MILYLMIKRNSPPLSLAPANTRVYMRAIDVCIDNINRRRKHKVVYSKYMFDMGKIHSEK